MTRLTIQNILSRQLSKPEGIGGYLTARLMASANREMYNFVLSRSENLGNRVLEIGFGGGSHFSKLLERTSSGIIDGIDISDSMVKLAGRNNKSLVAQNRLRLKKADSNSIPFPESSFDNVLTINTIYFWNEPVADLSQIHGVLKSRGRLILGMNSKEVMLKNGYSRKFFNFYDKEDVLNLLKEAGYKEIIHSYEKLKFEDCHLFIAIKQ